MTVRSRQTQAQFIHAYFLLDEIKDGQDWKPDPKYEPEVCGSSVTPKSGE